METFLGSWLLDQAAFPDSLPNSSVGNVADALEADAQEIQTLLELQRTREKRMGLLQRFHEKEIGLLQQLYQIRAGRQSSQEPLPPFAQHMMLPDVETVVTIGSLLSPQPDNAIPNFVGGDSGEATFFEIPRFADLPSNLSDSTNESANDSTFVQYSYEPASDDRGIHSDGNCSLTSTLTFPPVTGNEGEASTTVSFVNQTEPAADCTTASSFESPKTQVPVLASESAIIRPNRRLSGLDLPGVDCFSSNKQISNFRKAKRQCTDEERENFKAVRKYGACLSCREGKRQVSYIML